VPYADPEAKKAYDRERQRKLREAAKEQERGAHDDIPVIVCDYRNSESHRVYPMGDFHLGSPACDLNKLDEWLEYLSDAPNVSLLNTGDNLNCAIPGSKSDPHAEKLSVGEAMEEFEGRMAYLAMQGKLDCLTGGNHEGRVYNATGIDVAAVIARNVDVPHFEGAAVLKYLVGDQEYLFWVRHGTGNSPASMPAITKAGLVALADVYVTGHTHRQTVVLDDFFVIEDDEVVRRPRRYVTSGSFTLYERYAQERGYSPSHLGAPRIFLDGTRHDVHVSI
jgi:hypothetical protein